jgi:hypothetical protein
VHERVAKVALTINGTCLSPNPMQPPECQSPQKRTHQQAIYYTTDFDTRSIPVQNLSFKSG